MCPHSQVCSPSGSGLHEPWKESPLRSELHCSIYVCAVSARCRSLNNGAGKGKKNSQEPASQSRESQERGLQSFTVSQRAITEIVMIASYGSRGLPFP